MFVEEISSPWLLLRSVVLEVLDGRFRVITLHNVTLVALADVIVEGVFESNSEELVGSLDLKDDCSNDGIIFGPAHWDNSSSVKETWSDDVLTEVLLESALSDVPANNFDVFVGHVVPNLNNMESVVVVVVTLESIALIMVKMDIVMSAKLVWWIDS